MHFDIILCYWAHLESCSLFWTHFRGAGPSPSTHPVEPTTTACDSRPGLGRIQDGSQGSILNFHILVQCKYVFLLNFEALLCARVNIVLSEMSACGCY
jgi:hypothetical protein